MAPAAERDLKRFDRETATRIARTIDALAVNPRPAGVKTLKGSSPPILRHRVGDYRILYRVTNKQLVVLVIRVGHRNEIYRLEF